MKTRFNRMIYIAASLTIVASLTSCGDSAAEKAENSYQIKAECAQKAIANAIQSDRAQGIDLEQIATNCGMTADEKQKFFSSTATGSGSGTSNPTRTQSAVVIASLPGDSLCRIRYVSDNNGDPGYLVFAGTNRVHSQSYYSFSSAVSMLTEAITHGLCSGKAVEICDLEAHSDGFNTTLAGFPMTPSTRYSFSSAVSDKDEMVAAGVCKPRVSSDCRIQFVGGGSPYSDYQVLRDGKPTPQKTYSLSSAGSVLQELRSSGYCRTN